jgi:hypothetical protein
LKEFHKKNREKASGRKEPRKREIAKTGYWFPDGALEVVKSQWQLQARLVTDVYRTYWFGAGWGCRFPDLPN